MGPFELLSDGSDMPLITWTLTQDASPNWDLHDLSAKLRERGWQVPAYPMPADIQDLTVMRAVIRKGVSLDLTGLLLDDLRASIAYLRGLNGPMPKEGRSAPAFHH